MEELTGTVEKFLFKNEENGFSVFVIKVNQDTQITVRGYVPGLHDGQRVELKGAWAFHPKFGKQFESQQFSVATPTSVSGLKKYLGSGMIKGIGKVYGEKLVDHFGVDVLTIIDKTPERLSEVSGIGTKRVEGIIKAWHDQKEISTIMVFLQEKGASPAFATKIYKQYGKQSIAIMTENPYRIAEDIWGIGFKTADAIAQNIGFEKYSIKRIKAGILFSISEQTSNGHLYVELENLKKITLELLELTPASSSDKSQQSNNAPSCHPEETKDSQNTAKTLKNALCELYDQEKIKLLTHENKHYVTLPQLYFTERAVAAKIINLQNFETPKKFDIQKIYQDLRIEKKGEVALNDLQQEGIMNCLQHKITVITGGPGTGKTTLIKKL
ncbi:ATP-dependent RecD-like DNA helicase, partial [bacterium]|nr:ATP-dependent RecD-like DNA helicase [bacterium]